jgi:hypothetical protein
MKTKIILLQVFSALFGLLGKLIKQWPLMVLVAVCISPVGPHLRTEYTYREVYGEKYFISCDYIGSRGPITLTLVDACPFVTILDTRTGGTP